MDASVNRIASSKDEKALLIAIRLRGENKEKLKYSLEELKLLVKTAGGIVTHEMIVSRDKIDAAHIVGKGFLDTLKDIVSEKSIKLIVFDMVNMRPAQVRNLEEILKCRVVGRNEIILDIFARRARSAESKIQVELAQLRYILPRLKGLGGVLSRLGGGIGTRGPGEKMLETDKRHILRRISKLKSDLKKYEAHRERTRSNRNSEFLGSVVGYTNAGKSTLINRLANDDLFVENRLFATLDSYTRSVYLKDRKSTLLTDTIGFIQNLPANLIESFRSTLEDIANSDYIIHVIDINAIDIQSNIDTVMGELADLDSMEKPSILFFNKSDLLKDESKINLMQVRYPEAIIGSVKDNIGIDELRERMFDLYQHQRD